MTKAPAPARERARTKTKAKPEKPKGKRISGHVVKSDELPIESLLPYAKNTKHHSAEQVAQIAESIARFGFVNPIAIWKGNEIIAGHGRVLAAQKLIESGEPEFQYLKKLPVRRCDHMTDMERRAYSIADNKLAENAEWNETMLAEELEILLGQDEVDILLTGFDDSDITEVVEEARAKAAVNADNDVPPAPVKAQTKPGDIIILGPHRLMCGDSTNPADVEKLMGGAQADMLFTDPPYGVSFDKKAEEINKRKGYSKIKNDDLRGDQLKDFFGAFLKNAAKALKDTGSYYVFSCQGGDQEMMMMMMREAGIPCRHQLIWLKDNAVFSMNRLDYDYRHEPILYGWKKTHKFFRNGEQVNSVWEYPRTENKLHPTMKPVELIINAIRNSTVTGAAVLDLFGGSGSTLIACEQTDRKCFTMELDPVYCDVIIKRFENLSGTKAKRIAA